MCGLLGAVGRSATEEAAVGNARQALQTLTSRGPDGARLEQGVGWLLGHTRLAILDLTDLAAQPMSNERGGWLVYNGEIYNFEEIRRELESLQVRVRSTGDTEVLLAALQQWGTDALQKLRGMFAFAWLNPEGNELVLARDRYGVKPLVWEETKDGVRFASDLFALDAMAGGAKCRKIDPQQVRNYLMLGYVPAPHTIWEGPRKVLPGHFIRVRWRDDAPPIIQEQCYWALSDVPQSQTAKPGEDFSALSEKLREAVRLRLISDVPVGLLLSGGIDSSLVGAAYSGLPGANIPSFTMGFDDPASDERPYASAVAKALQLRHEEFVVDTKDVVAEFERLWSSFDEPFADSSALPTLVLCREIRKRVKVVIGGDGGDEVWCGYPWHRAMSKLDRIMWLPGVIRRAMATALSLLGAKWRYFARVIAAPNRLGAWTVLKTGLTDRTARYLPVDAEPRPLTDCLAESASRVGDVSDTLDWACRMDLASYLPDDLLVKADRASMAVGLELREPLLDAEFTTAGLALPSSARFEKETGRGKTFARRFLADFLPADLINRPKRGFTPPLDVWLPGPLKAVRERAIAELEAGKLYPLKLPDGVASWAECSQRLDDIQQQFLWRIICFAGWKAARFAD